MQTRSYLAAAVAGAAMAGLAATAVARPVTFERLVNANAEPQNWLSVHQNYGNWRYSGLRQINRDNVQNLVNLFTVSIGGWNATPLKYDPGYRNSKTSGEQAVPLADDGYIYVPDSMNKLMKIDVRSGNKGTIVWRFDPQPPAIRTTRGVALYGDNVYMSTSGMTLLAVNKESGEAVWEMNITAPTDPQYGTPSPTSQTLSTPPTVVRSAAGRDIVLQGEASGGSRGTRSWIGAWDANTGEFLWRFFTIPGPGEFGHDTWLNNAWITGGGGVWSSPAFDPKSNVAIYGTGDIFPSYDPEFRPGDNLFAASTVALDVDSGKLQWYFQSTPDERWDADTTSPRLIFSSSGFSVQGYAEPIRAVVANFDRQGYHYMFDLDASMARGPNSEGAFIMANPYTDNINWTKGIDPKTGKPVEYDPNLATQVYLEGLPRSRMGAEGAKLHCPYWIDQGIAIQPPTFDPVRRIHFYTSSETCTSGQYLTDFRDGNNAKEWVGQAGCCWSGGVVGEGGLIVGIDVDTGKRVEQKAAYPFAGGGGLMTTAGSLVFMTHADGKIAAYDTDTLAEVWSYHTGTSIRAAPISYAVDSRQYVAVVVGGVAYNGATLPSYGVLGGASLYVFGLKN